MAASTVFLIGFMGSGKSTLGKKLAAKLNFTFIDLDDEVCKAHDVPDVKTLVEQKGIDFFRQAETNALHTLNIERAVVSTGGGTPCYANNIAWMKSRGVVVFLQLDEGVIFSRLKTTNLDERPLLKGLDDAGLKQFITEKLAERLPYYQQAHIIFNPVKQGLEDLLAQLR